MRRTFTVALAAAVVLALGGCVGIPTSGGVNDGPVIDDQAVPDFVVLPSDPVPGSTQEQILTDFMQAVGGPQNGYAVAKKFLTADFAGTWNPDVSAIIRTGSFDVEATDASTMTYSFTSRASVNEQGERQDELNDSPQVLTFVFAQENGEWRISQAADGIVLSQSAFNVAFREQALYFFDPSYAYLVPDVRWFPSRQTSSSRVVQALLTGPSSWLQQAVVTAFPDATTFSDITTESGSVVVDLSTEALTAASEARDRMRQQLVATLDTPNVALTVRGLDLATPNASGNRAVKNPGVDAAVLVGVGGTAFGFDGGAGIAALGGLTAQVVAGGAVAASLASDKQSVAFLDANGGISVALAGSATATLIEPGPGLAAPSIDPLRFIWSAEAANASTLTAWEVDGTAHAVPGLPSDSAIVSLDVSRDGARLLLLLSTPVGPRLIVVGIIRQDNVPIALGEPFELPVGSEIPLDATWVDDRTVATVSTDEGGNALITLFEVGGPSLSLGHVQGAYAVAGGSGGADGLRVLTTDGDIWRPRGSEGWVVTGITASFLGTKQ